MERSILSRLLVQCFLDSFQDKAKNISINGNLSSSPFVSYVIRTMLETYRSTFFTCVTVPIKSFRPYLYVVFFVPIIAT